MQISLRRSGKLKTSVQAELICQLKCFKDDFLMGTLTVRENIAFSAALRLPPRYNGNDRRQKVDQVIKELGLTHIADSKVTKFNMNITACCTGLKIHLRLELSS